MIELPVTLGGLDGPIIGIAEVSGEEIVIFIKPADLVEKVTRLTEVQHILGISIDLVYRPPAVEKKTPTEGEPV